MEGDLHQPWWRERGFSTQIRMHCPPPVFSTPPPLPTIIGREEDLGLDLDGLSSASLKAWAETEIRFKGPLIVAVLKVFLLKIPCF